MEQVLKVLLEVENLTVDERTQVQDGLAFIRSDAEETSTRMSSDLETFSDLSALVGIRYRHQSEEEASAVRVARVQTGGEHEGPNAQPHRPAAEASERRQLAKEINDIIKASTAGSSAGESTGLNRRARWNTEKAAAGSTLPSGVAAVPGNTANAQATARKSAQAVSLLSGRWQRRQDT